MNFREIPDDAPDDLRNWNYNKLPYACSDGYCGADDCKQCHPLTWDLLEQEQDDLTCDCGRAIPCRHCE